MVDEYMTMVVGNSIVVVPGVDGLATCDDLIKSIFLAQLVANKKIEKSPGANWYDAYVEVLDNYWLRQEKSKQEWAGSHNEEQLASDLFTAMLTNGALGEARTTAALLARMATLSGVEPALQLLRGHMQASVEFETDSVPGPLMDVRLLVIHAKSPTSMTSAYVEFKTRQVLSSNPFRQSYQPDDLQGMVRVHHARANLSEMLYGPARDAIALKIKDRLAGNVMPLNLCKTIES